MTVSLVLLAVTFSTPAAAGATQRSLVQQQQGCIGGRCLIWFLTMVNGPQTYLKYTEWAANNTVSFNVTGIEQGEPGGGVLIYNVTYASHVTLTYYQSLKAYVVCQGCTIGQNDGHELVINYAGATSNSRLVIVWNRPVSFGIVIASSFFTLIVLAVALLYVSSGFSLTIQVLDRTAGFLDGSNSTGGRTIHYDLGWAMIGVMAIIGYLVMVVFAAQIFGLACPTGYTCTG